MNTTDFIRVEKRRNYTTINNEFMRNKKLSWKAKGILAYILTLPDDWKINLKEIMTHATEGETAFRSGWKELEEAGYVDRYPVRDEYTKRIIRWHTVVRELPKNTEKELESKEEKPDVENLNIAKGNLAKGNLDNDTLLSTKELSTKELSTDSSRSGQSPDKEKTPTTTDTRILHRFYQQNFGVESPFVAENIEYWAKDLNTELVLEAMKRASLSNKPFRYAEAIMDNWYKNNIRTLEQVEAEDKQFQRKMQGEPETKKEYSTDWKDMIQGLDRGDTD